MGKRGAFWPAAGLIGAAVAISLVLNLPVERHHLRLPILAMPSVEVAILVLLLAVAGRWRHLGIWRGAVAVIVLVVTLVKLGEFATRTALGRPLNLYLDFQLSSAIGRLAEGTFGPTLAVLLGIALLVTLLILAWLAARGVGLIQRGLDRPALRRPAVAIASVCLALFAVQQWTEVRLGDWRGASSHASRTVIGQAELFVLTGAEEAAFQAADRTDRWAAVPNGRLLADLRGIDVILLFVESYGRSAVEDARYAPVIGPRLEAMQAAADGAGIATAAAYLTSPIQGGQSWLARGALLSGLWTSNGLRYGMLIGSDRSTLIGDFDRAGHHTVAVMPAIQLAWPEGDFFGYDATYPAAAMGYQGPPYNWVTMPDQYTLSFLERLRQASEKPILAEVALISSHAPWTPIAAVVDDWSLIGDGRIFARWVDNGEPPAVVWREGETVRAYYARSIEYALAAVQSWTERFIDGRTLAIVVGDHQPAPLITGENASRDVPMHVFARDPALIQRFLGMGFVEGVVPKGPALMRMDAFRDRLIEAFTPAERPAA